MKHFSRNFPEFLKLKRVFRDILLFKSIKRNHKSFLRKHTPKFKLELKYELYMKYTRTNIHNTFLIWYQVQSKKGDNPDIFVSLLVNSEMYTIVDRTPLTGLLTMGSCINFSVNCRLHCEQPSINHTYYIRVSVSPCLFVGSSSIKFPSLHKGEEVCRSTLNLFYLLSPELYLINIDQNKKGYVLFQNKKWI